MFGNLTGRLMAFDALRNRDIHLPQFETRQREKNFPKRDKERKSFRNATRAHYLFGCTGHVFSVLTSTGPGIPAGALLVWGGAQRESVATLWLLVHSICSCALSLHGAYRDRFQANVCEVTNAAEMMFSASVVYRSEIRVTKSARPKPQLTKSTRTTTMSITARLGTMNSTTNRDGCITI